MKTRTREKRERPRGRQASPRQAQPQSASPQRAAGNHALGRMLGSTRVSLAREIAIGTETIRPYSKGLVDLYQDFVVPWLERGSWKTYGVKTRLVQFVKEGNPPGYRDREQFLKFFTSWLLDQKRKVGGGREVGVLREFDVMGMSRPAFPDDLKQSKGVEPGDNLRHVVRNATLKCAMKVEFDRVGGGGATATATKEHFGELAKQLRIPLDASDPYDQIIRAIYVKAYLNPANLFAGNAPWNQVIGLAADEVRKVGEALLRSGDERIMASKVIADVMEKVVDAAAKVRAGTASERKAIVDRLGGTIAQAIMSVATNGVLVVEDAADVVIDIGLGFGWDFIDGKVPEDTRELAERQKGLHEVEMELRTFIDSKGQQGSLLLTFEKFLALSSL